MVRAYVLRYLGRIADGASLAEARRALPALLETPVRAAARRHVIAAGFETERADDPAHVHRLAYLRALGAATPDANDPVAVERRFTAKRRADLEAGAALRLALGLGGVLVALGIAVGGWLALGPRSGTPDWATETTAALPELRAVPGGAPEEEPPEHPLTNVFRGLLPDYVVALDALSSGRPPRAPGDVASTRLLVLEALEREEPSLGPSMMALLDAAETFVRADDALDDRDLWWNRLVRFHDALDEAAVPFYVDATLMRRNRTGRQRLLLSTYSVDARRTFLAGDRRIRSLELTRLDTLNFDRALLGYTRPEVRYALVLADKIERFLVRDALPSVHAANESVIVRGYEDEVGTSWVTDFEEWAHEDLRAEAEDLVRDALGGTGGLDTLAAAVVQRRNGISELNHALRSRGIRYREPEAYDYDAAELSRLGPSVPGHAVAAVRQAERALASAPVRRAYEVLRKARSRSIAEHEVQHRLDFEADRLVAVPATLARHTGETVSEDRVNARAESANAELSAYLAQIARRPALARTSLIHVLSFAMNRRTWRKAEAYAALALIEALAREANIGHGDVVHGSRVARAEVARIYGALRERTPAQIAHLAARAWARLYGAPLPPLAEEPP